MNASFHHHLALIVIAVLSFAAIYIYHRGNDRSMHPDVGIASYSTDIAQCIILEKDLDPLISNETLREKIKARFARAFQDANHTSGVWIALPVSISGGDGSEALVVAKLKKWIFEDEKYVVVNRRCEARYTSLSAVSGSKWAYAFE